MRSERPLAFPVEWTRLHWTRTIARLRGVSACPRWVRMVGLPVVLVVVAASGLVAGVYGAAGADRPAWRNAPNAAANDYELSTGFSDQQGGGQWYYQEWDGTHYDDMTWDPTNRWWQGRCQYCIISRRWVHPDTLDVALAWKAPRSGRVTITGTMDLTSSSGGDGVRTVINQRTGSTVTKIWPSQPYQEIKPNFVAQHILTTDVRAGDVIYFQTNRINTSSYDTLSWDPRISYGDEPMFTLDSAQLVMTPDDFQRVGITVAQDSSLSVVPDGAKFDFYHSADFGRSIQKFQGDLDQPAQTSVYNANRFTNPRGLGGQWWIENVYRTGDGSLLAFCHIEKADVAAIGFWALGLAYSTDNGNTFQMLGVIVSQHLKDTGPNNNIFGVPYVVKDGYFYVYYGEPNAAVARAPMAQVLDAAKRGTVSPWQKYYNGGWQEPALGGQASTVIAGNAEAYATHGDAAYSTYLGRYLLSGYGTGVHRGVFLTFSDDAVCYQVPSWILNIPDQNALAPYETIVNLDGSDNGVVGRSFYIYYAYRFDVTGVTSAEMPSVWRWLYRQKVTLNQAGFDQAKRDKCP